MYLEPKPIIQQITQFNATIDLHCLILPKYILSQNGFFAYHWLTKIPTPTTIAPRIQGYPSGQSHSKKPCDCWSIPRHPVNQPQKMNGGFTWEYTGPLEEEKIIWTKPSFSGAKCSSSGGCIVKLIKWLGFFLHHLRNAYSTCFHDTSLRLSQDLLKGCRSHHCTYILLCVCNMGVSKDSGTPKWMVYNGKPY